MSLLDSPSPTQSEQYDARQSPIPTTQRERIVTFAFDFGCLTTIVLDNDSAWQREHLPLTYPTTFYGCSLAPLTDLLHRPGSVYGRVLYAWGEDQVGYRLDVFACMRNHGIH